MCYDEDGQAERDAGAGGACEGHRGPSGHYAKWTSTTEVR